MKKIVSLVLIVALLGAIAVCFPSCSDKNTIVLNVYNWGEYISDGSEGTMDVNREFEKYYFETYGVKVRVNYTNYASNEDMYAKLSSGALNYDVIVPSDYMIAQLISEGLLEPLNFDNIPNYSNIAEEFKGLYYDPDNLYTVPYTYGRVGIIYNANVVDAADVGNWDLMWNSKYKGNILQFNNSRDAFGTAMYALGIDVNTTDEAEWKKAFDKLAAQKPLVKSYVMDEIFNMMESGEGAIAAYYAGDYFTMKDLQADSVDLRFYYPENTNLFVDAMCIPKGAANKDVAEAYINYMLSEEPAIANAEYIYYASPNKVVYENEGYKADMGEEAMSILYPADFDFAKAYDSFCYKRLDNATKGILNGLWEDLKIE